MRIIGIAATIAAAALVPAVAQAQDMSTGTTTTAPDQSMGDASGPRAPDGTKAFGFVPYVGVMGGWESFDNERNSTVPQTFYPNGTRVTNQNHLNGGLVQGVVGVNVPLGPLFAGVEGNVAKGFSGNIDWEYGAAARGGFRAGTSGLFYGKIGYEWVQFDHFNGITNGGSTDRKYGDWEYGVGFEVGPKDIGLGGLTNRAGVRLRGEVSTFGGFHSFRPMLGVITHF